MARKKKRQKKSCVILESKYWCDVGLQCLFTSWGIRGTGTLCGFNQKWQLVSRRQPSGQWPKPVDVRFVLYFHPARRNLCVASWESNYLPQRFTPLCQWNSPSSPGKRNGSSGLLCTEVIESCIDDAFSSPEVGIALVPSTTACRICPLSFWITVGNRLRVEQSFNKTGFRRVPQHGGMTSASPLLSLPQHFCIHTHTVICYQCHQSKSIKLLHLNEKSLWVCYSLEVEASGFFAMTWWSLDTIELVVFFQALKFLRLTCTDTFYVTQKPHSTYSAKIMFHRHLGTKIRKPDVKNKKSSFNFRTWELSTTTYLHLKVSASSWHCITTRGKQVKSYIKYSPGIISLWEHVILEVTGNQPDQTFVMWGGLGLQRRRFICFGAMNHSSVCGIPSEWICISDPSVSHRYLPQERTEEPIKPNQTEFFSYICHAAWMTKMSEKKYQIQW